MADGLEEPGWPQLHTAGEPNPGATFMNAFSLVANTNNKRRALEEKIHDMQLDDTLKEQQHQIEISRMNQNAALAMQRMNLGEYVNQARLDIAQQNANSLQERVRSLTNQRADQAVDVKNFYDALNNSDIKPGDPEFPQFWTGQMANSPLAGRDPSVRATMKQWAVDHNVSAAKQLQSINADDASLIRDIKNTVPGVSLSNVFNRDVWQPQYKRNAQGKLLDENNNVIPTDANGNPTPESGKRKIPTEKFFIEIPPDPTQPKSVKQWRTVDQGILSDWFQRKASIDQRRAKVPGQLNDPDLGVNTVATTSNPVVDTPQVPNSRIIEKGGHHYEVNDSTRQVIRQID